MINPRNVATAIALSLATVPATVSAQAAQPARPIQSIQPVGHITGVGGIFFKSKDPKALMAWYRDVLGIKIEPWGGAIMAYDAPQHPPAVLVTAFAETSTTMAKSNREFMINFAVDDLSAFLDRLKTKGIVPTKRDDSDPYGKFAWIRDPDGTTIEFYEPKAVASAK